MAAATNRIKQTKNSKTKEWHWKLVSRNGKVKLIGGEGFKNKFTDKDRLRIIAMFSTAILT